MATLGKGRAASNYPMRASDVPTDPVDFVQREVDRLWPGSALLTIVDKGKGYDHAAPDLLVASLFFVELIETLTGHCIRLRCRIPASTHLQSLTRSLRCDGIRVYVRSGTSDWSSFPVVNEAQWDDVKAGRDYEMMLPVTLSPHDIEIHVKIDCNSQRVYISNCPLTLSMVQQCRLSPASPSQVLHQDAAPEVLEEHGDVASVTDEKCGGGLSAEMNQLEHLLQETLKIFQ